MQDLDKQLFRFINRDLSNPVFDVFFPFWTDFQKSPVFYVLMFVLVVALSYKKNWKTLFIIASCALGMALANVINGKLIKPLFERGRPMDVILRTESQSSYSFPSGHTCNAFFMAMFLGLFFPRLRIPLFSIAFLTAFSRIYCGVHYPGDILGGAFVGMTLGFIIFKFLDRLMKKKFQFLSTLLVLIFCQHSFAWEDPTKGKPFFPWVWEDQLKPTFIKATDSTSIRTAAVGTASALIVHQYDGKIYHFSEQGGNLWMDHEDATQFGKLGNGVAGVSIAALQLAFDQKNGLKTSRALILTTVSHMSLAAIVRRNRPDNKQDFLPYPSSFPSGHTSSAFAVAGSMAYSYGWKGGVPAYLAASAIAVSRVKENRHWASDIVAGAFLGTFWARASFKADEPDDREAFIVVPIPMYDGMMLSAAREF